MNRNREFVQLINIKYLFTFQPVFSVWGEGVWVWVYWPLYDVWACGDARGRVAGERPAVGMCVEGIQAWAWGISVMRCDCGHSWCRAEAVTSCRGGPDGRTPGTEENRVSLLDY